MLFSCHGGRTGSGTGPRASTSDFLQRDVHQRVLHSSYLFEFPKLRNGCWTALGRACKLRFGARLGVEQRLPGQAVGAFHGDTPHQRACGFHFSALVVGRRTVEHGDIFGRVLLEVRRHALDARLVGPIDEAEQRRALRGQIGIERDHLRLVPVVDRGANRIA